MGGTELRDRQWYVCRDGRAHGPLAASHILELARAGHLRDDDHVWMTGQADWVPVAEVADLLGAHRPASPLGFSDALAMQRQSAGTWDAGGAAVSDVGTTGRRPGVSSQDIQPFSAAGEVYTPYLARSLTKLAEGSALATWKATRDRQSVPRAEPGWRTPGIQVERPALAANGPGTAIQSQRATVALEEPIAFDRTERLLPAEPLSDAALALVQAERPSTPSWLEQMSSVLGAARNRVEGMAAWAPGQLQAALSQLHAFGWNDLVDAIAAAFERMQVRTLDDLMDDARMRHAAHLVLDNLPWSAKTCVRLTIGAEGMERLVLSIRDWLRDSIPPEYRHQDIGPLMQYTLGSEAIAHHFQAMFSDLKSHLMQPLIGQQPPIPAALPTAMLVPMPAGPTGAAHATA